MDEHQPAPLPGGAAAKACTVLVVDTNTALLETLCAVFRTSIHRCVTASDTLEALCAIVEHRPAVVIIDADVGPLAPWQFCMLVGAHRDFADTRIVLSCSRDNTVERARAAAISAIHFLPRPFSAEEVLALLAVATPEADA